MLISTTARNWVLGRAPLCWQLFLNRSAVPISLAGMGIYNIINTKLSNLFESEGEHIIIIDDNMLVDDMLVAIVPFTSLYNCYVLRDRILRHSYSCFFNFFNNNICSSLSCSMFIVQNNHQNQYLILIYTGAARE